MRKLIADHMRHSLDTSAHVYVMSEVDMTSIVNFVTEHEESFLKKEGLKLTYTPFIILATVQALKVFPEMNASLDNDTVIYHKQVNIGLAVSVDNGLMVPTLVQCDEKSLLGLCREWPRQNENDKKAEKAESSSAQFRPHQGSQPQTPLSGVIFHSQS